MFRKQHSLVLKSRTTHNGGMNKNQNTQKGRRIHLSLREMWKDQVAANRAMLSLTPYYDRHRQDGR
jgi:hypothetical protein